MRMIDLVGPKGYVHGWRFVGVPGAKADAPRADAPKVAAPKAPGSLLDAYKGWRDSLTPAESKAMSFYQSPGFALMNGQLRGVDAGQLKTSEHATDADLARARQASKGLAGAIGKAPPLPRDTTVYRGFDAGQFGDLTPGKIITDKGFTSVSVNNDAGAVGRAASQAQAVITLPAGTRAAAGSVRELVLPPGSSFRVVSAQKRGKVTHVRLELIPRGGKKLANRGRAIQLTGGRVKTPGPQRAAGRRKLAAKKQALPGGSFPVPDVAYLKKAIRSVGRAPASKRPALKALIRKRAAELKAANTPGVKGTWAFQAANTGGRAIELVGPKGYEHNWVFVGVGAHDAPEEKADKMSANAFRRGDGTQEALAGHREAAKAHRAASQASSNPATSDHHAMMAALHTRVAGGRMTSNRAQDKAAGLRSGAASSTSSARGGGSLPTLGNPSTGELIDHMVEHHGMPPGNPSMATLRAVHESDHRDRAGLQDHIHATKLANQPGRVIDMATATTRRMPVVNGAADVQLSRSGPGKVTVMHKSSGAKVGTLAQTGKGWQGVHTTGAKCAPSGTMGGAVAGLVAAHNQLARGKKLPAAQKDGTATYAHEAGDGIDLAGALPHSTPANSSSDGPRVTTAGGSGAAGLTGEAAAVYAKLIKKGLKPGQAAALARRAAAMHAKASSPKASAA